MSIINQYFPSLSPLQKEQFDSLFDLYTNWNSKINVISRKDIDNLYLHHVLHSLSIAKYISFTIGTNILDVGTGGGFPGIPLAVFFPESHFVLLDSIGKKVKVAEDVSKSIGLQNVECIHSRVEDEKRVFDFVVSRAVMPLPDLVKVAGKNISLVQKNAIPNGIICLKGGDIINEIKPYRRIAELVSLATYFNEPFFETKKLVYLPINK